jgi:hypothetical protein
MDKQIKAVTRTMQIQYAFYITIAILLVVLYQSDIILEGTYAGDFGMQYILETIGILTTIALVPLSLKIFSVKLNKKIKMAGFENALKLYRQWSSVRLMIIAFITYLNIMIYYMTLNSIGGLCALIGLTASIFCLPGERKLREELNLVTKNEENKEEI